MVSVTFDFSGYWGVVFWGTARVSAHVLHCPARFSNSALISSTSLLIVFWNLLARMSINHSNEIHGYENQSLPSKEFASTHFSDQYLPEDMLWKSEYVRGGWP